LGGRLRRFPEYRVTLIILSGKVKDGETVEPLSAPDRRDLDCRITYFSEDVELGGVVAETPSIKRKLAETQTELPCDCAAFVYQSDSALEYIEFLRKYAATGDVHFTIPRIFSSLKAACDWLGLPGGACEALTEEANRASLDEGRWPDNVSPEPSGSPDQASR
jgi:hypothetical protein